MMAQGTRQTILISVADPLQQGIALEACNQLHFEPVPLRKPLPAAAEGAVGLALIYDGTPMERGAEVLRRLRRSRPLLPVHMFVPMRPGATTVVTAAGRTHGVTVSEYWRKPQDRENLALNLAHLLIPSPYFAVQEGLTALTPLVESKRCMAVIGSVMRIHSHQQRPTLQAIALELGTSIRSLLRHWPRELLGRPKTFCYEMTLLLAFHTKEWTHGEWARIAADLGVSEATLRRARKHLNSGRAEDPAIPFQAIAQRCGASSADIRRGLERLTS